MFDCEMNTAEKDDCGELVSRFGALRPKESLEVHCATFLSMHSNLRKQKWLLQT